ncbi:F0F1 ATP synthase subunit delta [Helicobacter didelphidarum]|uniref:F0F1 ATP synthase subunit delta n=1 Tax=Helicobacter didelphidarum TaxID=2040648 RepID=A0A3D8IEC6_9HELI|nr:F0F1 ATP synthase subunit delta [Helicobacter didelphidarum]RDU63450.1 F0F1 ATP synthase subunit delta [Helicobacter didelphidarum]
MQGDVVARKYARALAKVCKSDEIYQAYDFYNELGKVVALPKFRAIVYSHIISRIEKLNLLKSLVNLPHNQYANNLLELLVKNDRILLLPFIASELKKIINSKRNIYEAILSFRESVSEDSIRVIQEKLGKKLGVVLNIAQKLDNSFDGIYLEIPELGIEVAFLKDKFTQELQNFILKAI